jgi:uncharacterized radical SAM protein YgiQ
MISEKGSGFDVILVSGEPYADHPLSGAGVIARVLDAEGYRVGVIGRPDWRRDADFARLGRPRLFFGLTSGAVDSMLQNYTPLKRPRSRDPHAPRASGVPDRAVLVYANAVRRLFPGAVTVLGGVEASLRRFAHYDYWEDRVRRSLLLDSRADILVYGPGELQAVEIARRLDKGETLDGIPGTCVVRADLPAGFKELPSFEEASSSKEMFLEAQKLFSNRAALAQKHAGRWVLQHPAPDYSAEDLDRIYGLPFTRRIPPDHPGLEMGKFSVVTHRGCVGRCSFCALTLLQGDRIVSRSEESILEEVGRLTRHPDFKGYVDDLGGPSADMHGMDCPRRSTCRRDDCLSCPKLDRSRSRLIGLMRRVREHPGVKKAFVRSGVRFDLALDSPEYVEELARHHVSGLLKIAPEHVSPNVLRLMNKGGGKKALAQFRALFKKASGAKKQHLKYYFMVAHPGAGDREARELAAEVRRLEAGGEKPVEGVQVFTPTPMTASACMYWTCVDPVTGEKVHAPKTYEEKKHQRDLLRSG